MKYDALAEAYDTAYNAWAKYKSLGVVSQFTTAAPTTPIPARPTAPYRPDAYSGMYLPKEDGKEAGLWNALTLPKTAAQFYIQDAERGGWGKLTMGLLLP